MLDDQLTSLLPMRGWQARIRLGAAIVIVTSLLVACGGSQPAPGASSATSSQSCAWPILASFATSQGIDLTDSAAAYWLDTFTVYSDLRLTLAGRYPDARYASISVYTSTTNSFTANGVGSDLTDYQIAPDVGSINPWQQPGPAGGKYTVTLRTDASPGQVNTLPLAPAGTPDGTHGYLQYRVYLPAGGDFSKLVAPTITLSRGSTSTTLKQCANPGVRTAGSPTSGVPTPSPQATPSGSAPAPAQLQFYRPALQTVSAGYPNTDSAYLLSYFRTPATDKVVVIQARAPRTSSGDHPSPWPAPAIDLRYWSMCVYLLSARLPLVVNSLPDGTTDRGCRDDEQTKLNASSEYTFVIGSESQRAAIERVPGVTFMPLSSSPTASLYLLGMRNMLVNSAFGFPIQQVPQDGNPASAKAILGGYYPRAATCLLSTLTADGPAGCLP